MERGGTLSEGEGEGSRKQKFINSYLSGRPRYRSHIEIGLKND